MADFSPAEENTRLRALRELEGADTPDEPAFDELAELAAQVCGTPAALITLLDEKRLRFKARVGIQWRETDRESSFCAEAIQGQRPLIVPDARADARFATHALVVGEPGIRFYAGAPLINRAGEAFGALEVMDFQPRTLTNLQVSALQKLAHQVVAQLELRAVLQQQRAATEQAVAASEQQVRQETVEELMQIFSVCDDLVCTGTMDGRFRWVNPSFQRVLGYTPEELYGRSVFELMHPDDRAATERELERLSRGEPSVSFVNRYRTKDGQWRWLEWNTVPASEAGVIYGVARDQTVAHHLRHQSDTERDVLEALAQGAPLPQALDRLLRAVENAFPDVRGSVQLLGRKGRRLWHVAAPSLPPEVARAIDGLPIGPDVGACGAAADSGELVVVENIGTDFRFGRWRELAARHELRACWSMPIRAASGRVLGTFALYHRRCTPPTDDELEYVARATYLAGLVVERHQLVEHLRESERNLQAAQELAGLGSFDIDLHSGRRWWSPQMYRLFGIDPREEPPSVEQFDSWLGPDSRRTMTEAVERARNGGKPVTVEYSTVGEPELRRHFQAIFTFRTEPGGTAERIVGTTRETTSEKRAQLALQTSEERFRQLAENIREVFWILDTRSGQLVYVSPAYEQLWGRSVESLLADQAQWVRSIHPDDRERVERAVATIRATGVLDEMYRVVRPDGSVRWIHDRAFPIAGEAGELERVVGVADDVTAQKETEHALREQERRLAALIGNLPGVTYRCRNDENWTAEFVSSVITEVFGYSRDDLLEGRIHFNDMIHPEDRDSIRRAVDEALATRARYKTEFRMRTAAGDERWIRDHGYGVYNDRGETVAVEGFLQDITERRRANEAIRVSELRMRMFVEDARDAVLQLTPNLTIEMLNPAFESITGWPRARWIGRSFFDLVEEPARGRARQVFQRLLRGEKIPAFELSLLRPGGGHVVLEFTAAPEHADGRMAGLMAIGRDLTARKNLEEQLQQAQRMESVGQLAGGIAHDFNNILAVILMQSSLIENLENPSEAIREGLQQIKLAAERAAGLTRQLLTFSRRQHMQLRDIDASQVVEDLGKMLRRILGEDIELHIQTSQNLPLVHADVGMFEQVIMNLVVNARDAMPHGGRLTITTTSEESPSDESIALPGRQVVLTVEDTGMGIPPEVLPRIFEPFFTTKDVGKGTGLGLATVYGIVRQHGGTVKVRSVPGEGSTFRIELPAVERGESAAQRGTPHVDLGGGNETILVVEDEAVVRGLVRTVLEQKGYRVIEAVSGVAAHELWQERGASFDLLLTDMVMPGGLSGRELAKRIHLERPYLPVIYTSGYSADAVSEGFPLREGVNFLQKPFGPLRLLSAVRTALDEAAVQREQML